MVDRQTPVASTRRNTVPKRLRDRAQRTTAWVLLRFRGRFRALGSYGNRRSNLGGSWQKAQENYSLAAEQVLHGAGGARKRVEEMKRICSNSCTLVAAALLLACALSTFAQDAHPQKDTKITPEQTKELFRSLNQILSFASDDTKLPIQHEVKRRLITREQVEKYILDKFKEDKDTKRMQSEEIVLKKFGLLDRDFQLQPFLVSLLKEQIAGYYDNKTKTVNLLDWVSPDEQKPVIAHELTHALQDQHTDLDKWEPDAPDAMSRNATEDNQRLAIDERDTARDAVLEGQAMAVFVDYGLKPSGKSVLNSPDMVESMKNAMQDSSDSPVMARAPLLLQESLL